MLHSADSPDGPFRADRLESALCRTEVLQSLPSHRYRLDGRP
jgi:hypothetical protein